MTLCTSQSLCRLGIGLGLGLGLGLGFEAEEGGASTCGATDTREVVLAINAHHRDARAHVDEQKGEERLRPRHRHLLAARRDGEELLVSVRARVRVTDRERVRVTDRDRESRDGEELLLRPLGRKEQQPLHRSLQLLERHQLDLAADIGEAWRDIGEIWGR